MASNKNIAMETDEIDVSKIPEEMLNKSDGLEMPPEPTLEDGGNPREEFENEDTSMLDDLPTALILTNLPISLFSSLDEQVGKIG